MGFSLQGGNWEAKGRMMDKFALISVSDKTGVVDFAKVLVEEHGYNILSTGGTARVLKEAALPVTEVSDHTGFPEMMEGRIKTLHPRIHGGLLCRRDKQEHLDQAAENGIALIDIVAVNLYPFEATVARPDVTMEEAIENIDIGGPSMLRSAAKNQDAVSVVCDPSDYPRLVEALDDKQALALLRRELALKVYRRTSTYDHSIASYLEMQGGDEPELDAISGLPSSIFVNSPRANSLRYGENPHQKAALYGGFLDNFEQLQGKELSYNNIIDISAAVYLIGEFKKPTVAILKHTNPCGVASAENLVDAWRMAFETDRQAPFGGIIVVNQSVDGNLAEEIGQIFCEVIIAPEFSPEARNLFARKKNLRLMAAKGSPGADSLQEIRSVPAGYLLQDRDGVRIDPSRFQVVTEREPTSSEWDSLVFGWKVVRHVKSNAIVYARDERTLGVGAGQMSRVDSSKIAVWKAGEANLPLKDSIIASDAFFPFADGLVAAAEAGAAAAIQPGGSVRDEEVIAAANERGMAMVFTGMRHFRH